METRGKTTVYLLGSYESEILGAKLPSYRQSFGYFMYLHKFEKQTVRDSSRHSIEVISSFWAKAGIPVRTAKHSIEKLEAVFVEWKGLLKHKNRTTPGHKIKKDEFVERLDELFDIAHTDALTMIQIEEDRAFLLSQRQKGRPGTIGALDKVETTRRQRAHERMNAEAIRRQRSEQEMKASASQVYFASDSSSSDEDCSDVKWGDNDGKDKSPGTHDDNALTASASKRAKLNIMSPQLSSALDRTMISSRNATYVISEIAASLGHDVNTWNINRNSIQRASVNH